MFILTPTTEPQSIATSYTYGLPEAMIYIGMVSSQVPHVDYSSSDLITSYVQYVKQQLGLTDYPLPTVSKLGVISRKNRRRIVNEDQLVEVARNAIQSELIDYAGLSFKEQVSHRYLKPSITNFRCNEY